MADPSLDERRTPYAALTLIHGGLLAGFVFWLKRRGRDLPEHIGAGDLALISLATQRTSRTISKDKVTEPFRAPFVVPESAEDAAPGEIEESPRDDSRIRHVIGELLLCPFCISQWIAAGFVCGLVVAPRTTRFVAAIMASVGLADFLQFAYRAAADRMDS
jgi:hypothetical protein